MQNENGKKLTLIKGEKQGSLNLATDISILEKALNRVSEEHNELKPLIRKIISAFVEECQKRPEKIKALYGDKDREELLNQFEQIMERKLEKLKAEMEKKIDDSKEETLDKVLDWFRQTAKGINEHTIALAELIGETKGHARATAEYVVKHRQIEQKLEELKYDLKESIRRVEKAVRNEPEWLEAIERNNPGLIIRRR